MKYLLQNKNWKFCLGDEEDAWRMDFDDSGWRDVELPSTGRWSTPSQGIIPAVQDMSGAASAGTDTAFFCRKTTEGKRQGFSLTVYTKTARFG